MNILITGGASGLGGAITRELASYKNNSVFFTYSRSKSKAENIESEFVNTKAIECDFRNALSLKSLIDQIEGLDLDILINNAYNGDVTPVYFHKTPSNKFLNDFKGNVIPTIEITQEVIKQFRKKKQGKIITILTSYLVNVPPSGLSIYIANKAYLKKLTQIWAAENFSFNIISNSISPSFMQTGLTDTVDNRVIEQMVAAHPQKKLLTIEEVAESVKYLINASNHLNGTDIILNGGVNIK